MLHDVKTVQSKFFLPFGDEALAKEVFESARPAYPKAEKQFIFYFHCFKTSPTEKKEKKTEVFD